MKPHLYPRSLQRQLFLIILGVSALAMTVAGVAFFAAEVLRSRAALMEEVVSTARLLGGRSDAALAFLDDRSARDNLASLERIEHIASACLLTERRQILAQFSRVAGSTPCVPLGDGTREVRQFGFAEMKVQLPVMTGEQRVGSIQISATTAPLLGRLASQVLLFGLAMAGALTLAMLLATRLQRGISMPLNAMRNLANDIVKQGDYSLRAQTRGPQELQDLGNAFNRVLATVETLTEELRSHHANLEGLVVERTNALEATLEQAKAANRAKSVFLSNMSHELRTPLNAVIGFSRLMARSDTLTDEQRNNLDLINKAGNHLLTLINDVLELSKIEAGRTTLVESDTNLPDLLSDVVDMLRPRAQQSGLQLEVTLEQLPTFVMVDPVKLRQILINLLGNAVKFTLHGKVSFSVHGQPLAGSDRWRLAFAVSDTGIGIAPEAHATIFEPFTQLTSHATSAGTGLGLAISAQFLAMLGGQFELDSAPGKGSRFAFELELPGRVASVAPTRALEQVALPASERGHKILVAEDMMEARQLLKQILEPLGFVVAFAVDGEQAVEMAESFAPDLILMDWNMPKLDGLEATRSIRAKRGGKDMPIVMLTASAFEEQRQEALAAGASDFMRKPLDEEQLFAVLARHMDLHFDHIQARQALPADALLPQLKLLAAADAAAVRELDRAVRELNPERIDEILKTLCVDAPQAAAAIQAMVGQFQYRELSALLAQALPANTSM